MRTTSTFVSEPNPALIDLTNQLHSSADSFIHLLTPDVLRHLICPFLSNCFLIEHEIDSNGIQIFYKNGQLHRDGDLPAVIYPTGGQEFYKNGQRHRDGDLPAYIRPDGMQMFYKNGQRHRDGDLPAVIYPNGTKEFYKNGHLTMHS